jgi:uncharacterized iron-regulated membrane protein
MRHDLSLWRRWLQQPQRVWVRRALFQVHLWTGLALGVYIVVLSLTGSALVYRRELVALFRTPVPPLDQSSQRLSIEELHAAARRAYPDYEIKEVNDASARRNAVVYVTVERSGVRKERLFHLYTGEDLGDSFTRGEQAVLWTVRLHDELLFGSEGRYWNGVGSALVTLLCLTGAVVWWPGAEPLAAESGRQVRRGLAPLHLGSAQRHGRVAVPVHPHVGRLGILHGRSRALHCPRRLRVGNPGDG